MRVGDSRHSPVSGLVALLVAGIVAACSMTSQEGQTPEPGSVPPAVDTSSLSFADNLRAREEAGEWTRGEGLVATLRLFAGEAEPSDVLRHTDIVQRETTATIELAHEYLEGGTDEAAKAEISRLLGLLVFSTAQLERMAGIEPASAALASITGAAPPDSPSAELDCQTFFKSQGIPPGVEQCLEFDTAFTLGDLFPADYGTYRVFYPAPSMPKAGWGEHHYGLALDALLEVVPSYKEIGKLPPTDIVFSVSGGGTTGDALAQAWTDQTYDGEPCGIVLYTSMQSLPDPQFKQTIAHEIGHCFEWGTWPDQAAVDYYDREWWVEGMAEYLSNVMYPDPLCGSTRCDLEWENRWMLADRELATNIVERSYDNFIFFQFLENEIGGAKVLDLIATLPIQGGKMDQEDALMKWPGIGELMHDFAQQLTDGQVADSGGEMIPYRGEAIPVSIDAPGTPYLEVELKPLGLARYELSADMRQVELTYLAKGSARDSARWTDSADWAKLPERLPDDDCRNGTILVVTASERSTGFRIDVPKADEVANSGSVEGQWILDNHSMDARIRYTFPQQHVDFVSGQIRANFRGDGNVDVVYDEWTVSGHSDASGFGDAELHTEFSKTLNARGTTTYRVSDDLIFYGDTFESRYLEGTEDFRSVRQGELFDQGGYAVEIDEDRSWQSTEDLGEEIFSAAQYFDLQCNGQVMRFLASSDGDVVAVLRRSTTTSP